MTSVAEPALEIVQFKRNATRPHTVSAKTSHTFATEANNRELTRCVRQGQADCRWQASTVVIPNRPWFYTLVTAIEENALVSDEQDRTSDAVVTVHLHPQGLTPSRCSEIRPKRVST
jgi:hypothetical protein